MDREQQLKERILVLEKKCKQLEEIDAQYCDEDEQRCKQIDAIQDENRELKKDNAFKAKQIQQMQEENLQLQEALEAEQKKAEEMLLRNAIRIGSKASCMKSPSGASTSSSSSRSSSSTAGFNPQIYSVFTGASSFGKYKFTRDFSSLPFTVKQNSDTSSIVSPGSSKNLVLSSTLFSSSQQLDDEGCQYLEDELGACIDGEQFSSNDGQTEADSDVVDANVVEGRAELVQSAFKMASRVKKQTKDVGMEQQHPQHLQQQLVAALSERVEQLELELKETHTKFEQQLEELRNNSKDAINKLKGALNARLD